MSNSATEEGVALGGGFFGGMTVPANTPAPTLLTTGSDSPVRTYRW